MLHHSILQTNYKIKDVQEIATQGSLYYQPKQCTINGKSLKSTIHVHCLIATPNAFFKKKQQVLGESDHLPPCKKWLPR